MQLLSENKMLISLIEAFKTVFPLLINKALIMIMSYDIKLVYE